MKNISWFSRCNKTAVLVLGGALFLSQAWADKTAQEIFSEVYKNKKFGTNTEGEGHSGGGSTLANTVAYRQFLQSFLKAYDIRSVVDLGCGDWEFSKTIDWNGIDYYGYDVVDFLIENNRAKYQASNIHFIYSDGIATELLPADLLICKDVLQHLPNGDIMAFIEQLPLFKYCLITNDVDPLSGTSDNEEICRGGFHPVDLTRPPFLLNGDKVFTYISDSVPKQVLFIQNKEK